MNQYKIKIKTWLGKEQWVQCQEKDENAAHQYVHDLYGISTEIIETQIISEIERT